MAEEAGIWVVYAGDSLTGQDEPVEIVVDEPARRALHAYSLDAWRALLIAIGLSLRKEDP